MEENNLPKIIRAQKQQKDKIKGVLKLGFSSDPLIRWVFPDPNIYLVNFDTWMEEFSKISFSNDVVFAEENFMGLHYGIHLVLNSMKHVYIQH